MSDLSIEAEVIPVDSASDAVNSLLNGKIDAFSSDQVVLIGLVLTSKDKGDFFISTELFSFEPFALAVRRNDADFRRARASSSSSRTECRSCCPTGR